MSDSSQKKRKLHPLEADSINLPSKRKRISENITQQSTVTYEEGSSSQQQCSSKVMQIFTHLYTEVISLHTWLSRLDIDELTLTQEDDPKGYKHLLHTTLVGHTDRQTLTPPASLSQASHIREVILRVIQRLKRKNINNVLCWGFDYMSDNPRAHVLSHTPYLEFRVPNSAFNRLQYKPWNILLSRIGDELMTRLLEKSSIFCPVSHSNYVQLTGIPIYELWSSKSALPLRVRKTSTASLHSPISQPTNERGERGRKRKRKDNNSKIKVGGHGDADMKKRKRERSQKMNSQEQTTKTNNVKPFDFHKLLPRQSILYARSLAEQLPPNFPLSVLNSPPLLSKRILEETVHPVSMVTQNHQQTECLEKQPEGKPTQQGDGLSQGQGEMEEIHGKDSVDEAEGKLSPICKQLLKNHRRCPYRSLLKKHCESRHTRLFQREKLKSVPVYTRKGKGKSMRMQPQTRSGRRTSLSVGQLLDSTITVRQVFLFVRAVCLKVLPLDLFGDMHNRKIFFKHLLEILKLGRHERYCLGQIMMKVKVTSYSWLRDVVEHSMCVRKAAQIHWWILTSFVFPLVKAFFYVTETNLYRNRLIYYRKSTWMQLHSRSLKAHLQRRMLTAISQKEVESLLDNGQTLGVSQLRFLPKLKSLRPVVNMGRRPETWTKKKLSINAQLKMVLSVLQYHTKENPALLGSGKFGFDDIFTAYRQFVLRRKMRNDTRPLYFVKTDFNKCFDNILQEKLFNIAKEIIMTEDKYITRRYASVMVTGDKLKRGYHRETFTLTDYEPDFNRFVQTRSQTHGLTDSVLVDQVLHVHTTSEQVCQVLASHLYNNIIKIGRRFYRQTVGIGQGSVLSTMLCSLYTASLEREVKASMQYVNQEIVHVNEQSGNVNIEIENINQVYENVNQQSVHMNQQSGNATQEIVNMSGNVNMEIENVNQQFVHMNQQSGNATQEIVNMSGNVNMEIENVNQQSVHMNQKSRNVNIECDNVSWNVNGECVPEEELMMRLVDDNLYITPYRDRAETFLEIALRGSRDYNLFSNTEKVLVNFDLCHPQFGEVPSTNKSEAFPWCGMLLDTASLSVAVDYSRYAGQDIRDTLTLDFAAQSGVNLKNKLLLTLRSRCHSLYLDPQVNTIESCVNTIYKACLLSAYKLHCYVLTVWPANRRNNHVYLKRVILILAQYLHHRQELILKEMEPVPEVDVTPLSRSLIYWLCIEAHINKLQKHHSVYPKLIKLLKRYRTGYWRRMDLQDKARAQDRERVEELTLNWSGKLQPTDC